MIDFPPLATGEQPRWNGQSFEVGRQSVRVISYSTNLAGWDEDLTALHESEAGDGTHPIDRASRRAAIEALRHHGFPESGSVIEVGCSSGFLLKDLANAFPGAELVGSDIFLKPLQRLGVSLPQIPFVQMDLIQCPIKVGQFDAVIALNVLEHIEDDRLAIARLAGLLKPGGLLILEVPQGPNVYDIYDAYLRHFRRYGRLELRRKCLELGIVPLEVGAIGFFAYLPFWIVKKINRLRFGIRGERALQQETLVRDQIKATAKSRILDLAFFVEGALSRVLRAPIGIRSTFVGRVRSQIP